MHATDCSKQTQVQRWESLGSTVVPGVIFPPGQLKRLFPSNKPAPTRCKVQLLSLPTHLLIHPDIRKHRQIHTDTDRHTPPHMHSFVVRLPIVLSETHAQHESCLLDVLSALSGKASLHWTRESFWPADL